MIDKNISALNGLRGIAALIVVFSHFSNETGLFGGIFGWGGGQTGVMLFFVLAGFLMTHLHIGEVFDRSSVGQYAIKRIARVYPFFVLVAALPALLLFLKFPATVAMGDINTFPIYIRQVLLIDKGSNVFWTIQIEILFYACFVALWGFHRYVGKPALTLVVVLGLIVALGLHGFKFATPFFGCVHYFLVGVSSALALQVFGEKTSRSITVSFLGLALLFSLPLTYPKVAALLFGIDIDPWTSILVLVQISVLFNIAIRDRFLLDRVLSSKPLVWVGKVSYSVYLLHYFVLMALVSWAKPSDHYFLCFLGFMFAVFVIAALSYTFLERPIQRFVLAIPSRVKKHLDAQRKDRRLRTTD